MFISGYSNCSLSDGPGARVAIYVSGCTLNCKGCHNPEAFSFTHGLHFNEQYKEKVLKDLASPYIAGLSLLGGDPLEPNNYQEVISLCKEVKTRFPDKSIWLWTGRKKEKVETLDIMKYLDVVVSDPYIEKFNNGKTKYRGSYNQRVWWAKDGSMYDKEELVDGHHMNSEEFKRLNYVDDKKSEICTDIGCCG